MKTLILRLLLLGMVLNSYGCGGARDLSGTYAGTETGTQAGLAFQQTVILVLTDKDKAITGTYSSASGGSGTVTGTANGDSIEQLTVTAPVNTACAGSLVGTGSVDKNNLFTATISGLTTCGLISATLSLAK